MLVSHLYKSHDFSLFLKNNNPFAISGESQLYQQTQELCILSRIHNGWVDQRHPHFLRFHCLCCIEQLGETRFRRSSAESRPTRGETGKRMSARLPTRGWGPCSPSPFNAEGSLSSPWHTHLGMTLRDCLLRSHPQLSSPSPLLFSTDSWQRLNLMQSLYQHSFQPCPPSTNHQMENSGAVTASLNP